MFYKEAITKIVQIEKEINLNDFLFQEINIWPLIRLNLLQLYTSQYSPLPVNENNTSKQRAEEKRSIKYFLDRLKLYFSKKGKYVLIKRPVEIIKTNEKLYDKLMDPVADLIGVTKTLSIYTNEGIKERLRFWNKTLIVNFFEGEHKELSEKDKKQLSELIIKTGLSDKIIIAQTNQILLYRSFYRRIFKSLAPKAVFISCHYGPKNFGLVAGAKELNIPTIEIQHGKQGKYNSVYSYWTKSPKKGYELLPDFFAQWGKSSKLEITKHSSKIFTKNHIPLVIGNPVFQFWQKHRSEFISKSQMKFENKINNKIKVLITLQPLSDPFPLSLVKGLNKLKNPQNYFLLVRLHPARVNKDNHLLLKRLKKLKIHYEIEKSTNIPLLKLFTFIDLHLTAFSSTCYEAAENNIPTILFHKEAKTLYSKEIKMKKFFFEKPISIDKSIESVLRLESKNYKLNYMVTDRKKVKANLSKLLKKL